MSTDIEKALVKKAQKGDTRAFEKLIINHEKRVYNIAFQMFHNEHDAYDVSQEVFIKVFKSLSNFNFKSSFSTWIYRIAVNTCIDAYRKANKKGITIESMDDTYENENQTIHKQYVDDSPNPEEEMMKKEEVNEVRQAINNLEAMHKTIVVLRDIKGYSYDEIADMLDCSIGTVKSRLSRARKKLKEILLNNREQIENYNV